MPAPQRVRLLLMMLAVTAMLAALWGGLLRIGWHWPLLLRPLPLAHGPLMISGFLGTLISLERAVALQRRWAYAGPLCCGLGGLLLATGARFLGPVLLMVGSGVVVAIFASILHQHPSLFTTTMAMGALAWLVGNLLWLFGRPISQVVFWWLGFLVITVLGERLELSRLLPVTRGRSTTFFVSLGVFVSGLLLSLWSLSPGERLSGVGMTMLAVWLARYDLARRTIRHPGLTRFIAVALLSGYSWLAVGGLLAVRWGGVQGGPQYDAILHSVFVGLVLSMVFGHAPMIFPAVLQVPIAFDRSAYGPLLLLHASLFLRIGGDLLGSFALRRDGGLLNATALLLFFCNTLRLAYVARGKQASPASRLPVTPSRQSTSDSSQ